MMGVCLWYSEVVLVLLMGVFTTHINVSRPGHNRQEHARLSCQLVDIFRVRQVHGPFVDMQPLIILGFMFDFEVVHHLSEFYEVGGKAVIIIFLLVL